MDFAAQGVVAGAYDIVIAGGVEMMSRVSMKANRLGQDKLAPMHHERFPEGMVHQGISAELIAANWQISRDEMDRFALRSHQRADGARARLAPGVVAIDGAREDEGIRPGSTLDKLASLKPAFENPDMADRFPQIDWSVTAANSSQVTDGAGAALIVEEKLAEQMGLTPMAAFAGFAVAGDDPQMMLTAPIPAARKLLDRAWLAMDAISAFEINEAFSSVVLAWQRETGADMDKVNRYGGAIALGHPVGASGIRLMANLVAALDETGGRYGVQSMCESGGMANATLIERL